MKFGDKKHGKIACLGTGAWGFALTSLLAAKGYQVHAWSHSEDTARQLSLTREHEMLPGHKSEGNIIFSTDLSAVLRGAELVIESVTSKGIRPVFEKVKASGELSSCPIIITSKGIEQNSGLILPEVVIEVLGPEYRNHIGALSGPSFAQDVIRGLPTSVVGSGFTKKIADIVCETFTTPTFRVYPNMDMIGVAYGGALKNIIAIACGISEGLALGYSCNAALITRGLHEIRKLAVARGCCTETLYGLSGMGDLCLTCSSIMSRNFRFGHLLAQGNTPEQAREKIGMVVEGAYTCLSALQLSREFEVPMPITETVYGIIYEGIPASDAVAILMKRTIKEEHL